MNDVMTDNTRCPFTEYTISLFLSIASFVTACRGQKNPNYSVKIAKNLVTYRGVYAIL